MITAPLCDYCGTPAILVDGRRIYPTRRDLFTLKFWLCPPCDAYVGCHKYTSNPLGRLANASLRAAKQRAHAAFDPIWKRREMTRSEAYAWLSRQLKIPPEKTHIGMFDEAMCAAVIDVCLMRELQRRRTPA